MNKPICRRLFRHPVRWPFDFALVKAGNSIAARIAMIAITTSSSMRVKPLLLRLRALQTDVFIDASRRSSLQVAYWTLVYANSAAPQHGLQVSAPASRPAGPATRPHLLATRTRLSPPLTPP